MTRISLRRILLAGGALAAEARVSLASASLVLLAAVAPAHAQDASHSSVLDEVVVTAQKRAQNLQDVPVAVTAITAESLESNRVRNVLDLNALVPNVSARPSAGGSSLPSFTVRGIQSTGAIPGAEKQVGIYIDGVYVGAAAGSVFELPYIQQIEVLRGPQGTLFGQNATAGAVNITTPTPTGDFGAKLDLTYGNYDQLRTGARLDLPAMGPFSASLAYVHSERRGDIRNLGAGTTWDFRNAAPPRGRETSPKWLGDENTEAVHVALKFEPTDTFSAVYKYFWVDRNATPEGVGVLAIDTAFAGGLIRNLLASPLQANAAFLTPITNKRPDAVNNWMSVPSRFRNQGHALTLQWEVTDSLRLKNVFGYQKSSLFNTGNQLDGFGGLFAAPGVPFIVLSSTTEGHNKQWSNELQLNYDSDFLTLTAGYLHYDFKSQQGAPPGLRSTYTFTAAPGFVLPGSTSAPPTNHTRSDAVYAQAEIHVTPKLDLILGGRHTWDDKSGTADFPGLPRTFRYKDERPSYSAGVNYKPSEDILLYGKYSNAYVAGGSYAGWVWSPETAKSWEAGIKSDLLDRRLRANLALFTVKYGDMQFTTGGPNLVLLSGRPELAVLAAVNANAGDARARGFELELTAVPVERLTLGAGVGYTHFKYLRTEALIIGPIDQIKPHHRPKWTTNLYAQYETAPVFGEAHLSFRVDANYRSRFEGSARDLSAALTNKADVPATWLVNGRVALVDLPVAGRKLEVAVWGRNLTNNRNISYPTAAPFIYPSTWERARTYGLDVSVSF